MDRHNAAPIDRWSNPVFLMCMNLANVLWHNVSGVCCETLHQLRSLDIQILIDVHVFFAASDAVFSICIVCLFRFCLFSPQMEDSFAKQLVWGKTTKVQQTRENDTYLYIYIYVRIYLHMFVYSFQPHGRLGRPLRRPLRAPLDRSIGGLQGGVAPLGGGSDAGEFERQEQLQARLPEPQIPGWCPFRWKRLLPCFLLNQTITHFPGQGSVFLFVCGLRGCLRAFGWVWRVFGWLSGSFSAF